MASRTAPTIWGHGPFELHDRFWAAYGVQVVRRREPSRILDDVELYLLCEPGTVAMFQLGAALETLHWLDPDVVAVRVKDRRGRDLRVIAVADEDGRLVQVRRVYDGAESAATRVGLTPDADVARLWQHAPTRRDGWRALRQAVPPGRRAALSLDGRVYDGDRAEEAAEYVRDLVARWSRPDATIRRATRLAGATWVDPAAEVSDRAHTIGPIWIGAGRSVGPGDYIVGPEILWDRPDARPALDDMCSREIEPTEPIRDPGVRRVRARARVGKRLFDVVFAAVILMLTLPLYLLVGLAVLLTDGWPVFFRHCRETVGGREFSCLKFRTMRRDAEQMKAHLAERNQADGPQFFMESDPRLTRVGKFLRDTKIDELPQFLNVLVGDMSVVGPRPSPRSENQFCPAWREARLSVRPGVTGLWQVMRTRERGLDFQEWIRYDLEYVERSSWRMDLGILWRTIGVVLRAGRKG